MKWILGFLLLILIAGGLIYYQVGSNTSPTATSTTPTTTATIITGVPDASYTDQRYSFSIRYPSTATSSAVNFDGYLPRTATPVVSFTLPSGMFQGTNLNEAGVYIGASTTPAIMQSCELPAEGETTAGTTTLDGQDFATFTATGVGAGNIYESTAYRTYQNGACFEIVELLHSGNIGNYTPGTVKEFDKPTFQGILDRVVRTYHPIPTGQ